MAPQRLTMLQLAALSVLAEEPRHAYDVYRLMLARRDDWTVKVRAGTLYHAIDRMAEQHLVQPIGTDRAGNRPERTVYRITASGREALLDSLRQIFTEYEYEYPALPLGIAELDQFETSEALDLLHARIALVQAELDRFETAIQTVRAMHLPARHWLELQYQRDAAAFEVEWLSGLTAQLADGSLDLGAKAAGHAATPTTKETRP